MSHQEQNKTTQTFNPVASQTVPVQAAQATENNAQPAFNSTDHRHYAMCG